jgi:hypothetical protein
MEDIRTYRMDEEETRRAADEDRVEYSAASDEEVPFHIPRD